jgi:hypothetical protein
MRLKRDNALRKYWGRSGLKAGSIEFRGLRIACLVRNQSETATDRTRHRCIIIWRTGKMIGVKFL